MQWFRMYAEAVDDEKLRLLAFEDRWHYVAILCLKSQGTLDNKDQLERRVGVKLGLRLSELDEVKRRLTEVGLIDENYQPLAWDKRQFVSDFSSYKAEKQKRYREKAKTLRNIDVTVTTALPARTEQNRTDTEITTLSGKPDPKPLSSSKKEAIEVLQFLNTKTGRNYEPVDSNIRLISARMKEGATVQDLKSVIAKKCREWGTDPKMEQFLRPKTLFNTTNFANYKGELFTEVEHGH